MPLANLPSGIEIAYDLNGVSEGNPALFVHGHGSRGSTFTDFIPHLIDSFYILTPDLRGHGASGKPVGETYEETLTYYTIGHFVEDLRELVDTIEFPKPFVLLGHSMGGMIAQEFALKYADIVSHLILCSTAPSWSSAGRVGVLEHLKNGAFQLEPNFFREACRMGMTRAFRKAHPEVIESSVQSRLLVPPDAYIGSMENLITSFDTRDRLGNLQVPTLILVGDQDAMVDSSQSAVMHELISNSKLVVIPGQNHGLFHEVPELVAAEMKNFIQNTE